MKQGLTEKLQQLKISITRSMESILAKQESPSGEESSLTKLRSTMEGTKGTTEGERRKFLSCLTKLEFPK